MDRQLKWNYGIAVMLFAVSAFMPMVVFPGGGSLTLFGNAETTSLISIADYANVYTGAICYFALLGIVLVSALMGRMGISQGVSALLLFFNVTMLFICISLVKKVKVELLKAISENVELKNEFSPSLIDGIYLGESWVVVAIGTIVLLWAMYRTYHIGGMRKIQTHHVEC